MPIDLTFNNSTSDKKFGKKLFEDILTKAARALKLKETIEVSVNLVSPTRIKFLNKKHRNKDRVTDVLSFPMGEYASKKYDIMQSGRSHKVSRTSPPILAGDIFICPSFVRKNRPGVSLDMRESMRYLAVHGFLHLMGYDHESSSKGALKMERMENKIMKTKRGQI